MPLMVFIDAIVDGIKDTIEDWDELYIEYCEAIGGKELDRQLRDMTELTQIKCKIQIATACMDMLVLNKSEEVFEVLKELYPLVTANKLTDDVLRAFEAHISRDVVEYGIMANDKKEEANKSKNSEYTRNYFTDTLIAISAAFKVNVGMNISLREYCRWVVKYREYAEEMNKKNII